MDKEKDNSNIEEKVTISDLAEKAATMKQEEPKPKKRIGLGIMVTVLIILLVGGALATGYLWGNNTVKPIDDNAQSSSSKTNNKTTTEPEPKEEQAEETIAEEVSDTQNQNLVAESLSRDYFYISDWGVKIKTPGGAFSYATDGQYRVFVWGHKYIQGEQAVPAHGTIGFWDDTIANPVYLGMIQARHCAYEDCNSAIFRSKDGSIGLIYQESTTAAEKYSSSEKQNPSLDPNYATMVTTDIEMLKEHFTNPNNYVEVK